MIKSPANFIFNQLFADAAVRALVANRIVPEGTDNQSYPYITYNLSRDASEESHSGRSYLGRPTYRIFCWSADPDQRNQLGIAVKAALQSFSGTVDGVEIQNCRFLGSQDGYRKVGETYFYRWIEFEIWFREPA